MDMHTPDPGSAAAPYEAPAIDYLGTLADLTKGGNIGPDDGIGGAGDTGTVGSI